jgi:prophage antirepressor-like protein
MTVFINPLKYQDTARGDFTVYIGYANDGERVVKAVSITKPMEMNHNDAVNGIPHERRKFASFPGINNVRAFDLESFREVARKASPTPFNARFLDWCRKELEPWLEGDSLPAVIQQPDRPPEFDPKSPFDVFHFDGYLVRTITGPDGEPWWLAADVCGVLGLSGDPGQHTRRLDDDETRLISNQTNAGPRSMLVVNESGLYSLILTSRKPEAKRFKKWMTSEVLPSLRKKGAYAVAADSPNGAGDPLSLALESTLVVRRQQLAMRQEMDQFQETQLQLTSQVGEYNARIAEAEAKAAEANRKAAEAEERAAADRARIADAEARIAESKARQEQAEARAKEYEARVLDAQAQSHNAHAEALRATMTAIGEPGWSCLAPWAGRHGVHLSLPEAQAEGRVISAMCRAAGIEPRQIKSDRYEYQNSYPEHMLSAWLESYRNRPNGRGPALFG